MEVLRLCVESGHKTSLKDDLRLSDLSLGDEWGNGSVETVRGWVWQPGHETSLEDDVSIQLVEVRGRVVRSNVIAQSLRRLSSFTRLHSTTINY